MKYILLILLLTSCSKTYFVSTYYGDKEMFSCSVAGVGLGSDVLYLNKDIDKVNKFCEELRTK